MLINNIATLNPAYEKSVIDLYSEQRNFVFSVHGKSESTNKTSFYFNTSFLITIDLQNGIYDSEIQLNKIFKISIIKIKISQ